MKRIKPTKSPNQSRFSERYTCTSNSSVHPCTKFKPRCFKLLSGGKSEKPAEKVILTKIFDHSSCKAQASQKVCKIVGCYYVLYAVAARLHHMQKQTITLFKVKTYFPLQPDLRRTVLTQINTKTRRSVSAQTK